MTHSTLKKHTYRDQVINFLKLALKQVTIKCTKNELTEKISVLSFMFYENIKIMMYKVIRAVIYTIIDDYICLDYMGLIQEKLSKHENNFENTKFNNLYGLGIP